MGSFGFGTCPGWVVSFQGGVDNLRYETSQTCLTILGSCTTTPRKKSHTVYMSTVDFLKPSLKTLLKVDFFGVR